MASNALWLLIPIFGVANCHPGLLMRPECNEAEAKAEAEDEAEDENEAYADAKEKERCLYLLSVAL